MICLVDEVGDVSGSSDVRGGHYSVVALILTRAFGCRLVARHGVIVLC